MITRKGQNAGQVGFRITIMTNLKIIMTTDLMVILQLHTRKWINSRTVNGVMEWRLISETRKRLLSELLLYDMTECKKSMREQTIKPWPSHRQRLG